MTEKCLYILKYSWSRSPVNTSYGRMTVFFFRFYAIVDDFSSRLVASCGKKIDPAAAAAREPATAVQTAAGEVILYPGD